jgi:hypothetical protein
MSHAIVHPRVLGVAALSLALLMPLGGAGTSSAQTLGDAAHAGELCAQGTPVVGDWNGDGTKTPGCYRAGVFHLRQTNTSGPAEITFNYGRAGDVPVVGDWNGNGRDGVGVVRGRAWYLRNALSGGSARITFNYGRAGDVPVVGDWNGNGRDGVGVVRGRAWYLRNALSGGSARITFNYGRAGDVPVVGDWNGNGRDGVGVVRGRAWYLRNALSGGPARITFNYDGRSEDDTAEDDEDSLEEPRPVIDRDEEANRDEVPEGAVLLRVGDDFSEVLGANAAGTHFVLEAGVHRMQSVRPRDGDRFSGQPGAVMSGAKVLPAASFASQGGRWFIGGQTQSSGSHGKVSSGHEREAHGEELWADGRRLRHVNSLSEVDRSGRWFFDYDDDRIWMFDDPASFDVVETSVTPFAFTGGARGVVIENLVVRHYANRAQRGAINAREGRDWVVRYVDASFNHGAGIGLGEGMLVHNSRFTYNGQLGIHASSGDDPMRGGLVVRDNEIAHNKQLGFRWTWEGGGTKFIKTQGMVFENNWVHHNIGPGAWWDIDNIDAVIRSNLIERNTERGLFYEISYAAQIYWNTLRDQPFGGVGTDAQGIYVFNSADVDVFENAVSGTHSPIWVRHSDRGESSRFGKREAANVVVRANDVEIPSGRVGLRVTTGEDEYYRVRGNRFEGNTYRHDRNRVYRWYEDVSWSSWRELGHDLEGTLLPLGVPPALPEHAVGFTLSHYGPQG